MRLGRTENLKLRQAHIYTVTSALLHVDLDGSLIRLCLTG